MFCNKISHKLEWAAQGGRRQFMARAVAGLTIAALAGALSGCGEEKAAVLRVGLLPDQSEDALRQRFKPLFDYVAEQAGIEYAFVIPNDYSELVTLFENHQLDFAYFGAYTFVKIQKSANARALVMRDVDQQFQSVFLVSAENPAKTLSDLRGQPFSFGSRLSTSGHLMPRFFLGNNGIDPEKFFSSVSYSGAHDKTAQAVATGKVAVGTFPRELGLQPEN
jgi:phosphonate transport system substrate-binding protein